MVNPAERSWLKRENAADGTKRKLRAYFDSGTTEGRLFDAVWTKALKYMLTNLKWCLAWVCKQTPG